MKPIVALAATAFALLTGLLFVPTTHAAVYGDKKDVTQGDLNEQDYWWCKYDDMMLDLAIKQRQPEGRIGLQLVSQNQRLDGLLKK